MSKISYSSLKERKPEEYISYLEKLKTWVKEENLIEDKYVIESLFESYKYDEKKPLEEQINDAIEWGYNNDELGDFYDEYRYELEESECIILVQSCNMKHNIAYTSVDLFRFNSKNKYYYIIQADGDFADLIDADSFYEELDTQDDESIIDYFKNICNNAYDIDGEILDDDLNESSIEFLENY